VTAARASRTHNPRLIPYKLLLCITKAQWLAKPDEGVTRKKIHLKGEYTEQEIPAGGHGEDLIVDGRGQTELDVHVLHSLHAGLVICEEKGAS
jgi:hypothetical protein